MWLYTCILGPRDCRCPRGAPGAGLWGSAGLTPQHAPISLLFCRLKPDRCLSVGMAAGKCHSLETSERHKFSNKHVCTHVCWPKGSARPQPEPPTGAKNWHKPSWALPGRARGCDTACPGTRAPGHWPSAEAGCPTAAGHRPAVAQTPCALDPCVQARCAPDPAGSGSHGPGILRPLHPLAPGPHTPGHHVPGLHTFGTPDPRNAGTSYPRTPQPQTSGTPYPCDLLLLEAPVPSPGTSLPAAPAPRHSRPAPAGLRALSQVSWNFASRDARAGAGPRPPGAANGRPGRRGGGQSALAGQFPGPDRPSPPGRRGGAIKGPRGGARRSRLPPLHCGGHGTGGTAGPAGRWAPGAGAGRQAVPVHRAPCTRNMGVLCTAGRPFPCSGSPCTGMRVSSAPRGGRFPVPGSRAPGHGRPVRWREAVFLYRGHGCPVQREQGRTERRREGGTEGRREGWRSRAPGCGCLLHRGVAPARCPLHRRGGGRANPASPGNSPGSPGRPALTARPLPQVRADGGRQPPAEPGRTPCPGASAGSAAAAPSPRSSARNPPSPSTRRCGTCCPSGSWRTCGPWRCSTGRTGARWACTRPRRRCSTRWCTTTSPTPGTCSLSSPRAPWPCPARASAAASRPRTWPWPCATTASGCSSESSRPSRPCPRGTEPPTWTARAAAAWRAARQPCTWPANWCGPSACCCCWGTARRPACGTAPGTPPWTPCCSRSPKCPQPTCVPSSSASTASSSSCLRTSSLQWNSNCWTTGGSGRTSWERTGSSAWWA